MKPGLFWRLAFLATVTMMSVIGLVASDIFLPALPAIAERFQVSSSRAQSMISVFLLGVAVMQLFYGPVSDSVGRKKLLLIGLVIFTLSSLAIPFATTFTQVISLRLTQAIGACAGITLGRAIVGDLYGKEGSSRIFLSIFPFVGMSPAIAPLIGGLIYNAFGWRFCFVFLTVYSALLLVMAFNCLPETLAVERRRPLSLAHAFAAYRTLASTPRFWRYTCIPCFAYAAYFAYISESPFLLTQQGVAKAHLGFSYVSLSVTYVAGNLVAWRLMALGRATDQLLDIGYRFFAVGGAAMLVATFFFPHLFAPSIAAISVLTFGNGFLLPLGTSGAVTSVPELAGSASGLMGALQLGSAATAALVVGPLTEHQPWRLGVMIAAICLVGFATDRWRRLDDRTSRQALEQATTEAPESA